MRYCFEVHLWSIISWIFEPENDEVERAIKALEEAAFPPEPEPEPEPEPVIEPESEQQSETEPVTEEVSEETGESTPDESEEELPLEEEITEIEEGEACEKSDAESDEPEVLETEESEIEEPEADVSKEEKLPLIAKIRSLAANNGSFTIAVSAAAVILALMVIIMAFLPDRRGDNTVSEENVHSSETVEAEQSAPSTLYITRIDKPGAPEKEYIPAGDTEVVEKTPLFWGIDVSEHQQEIDWQTVSYTGADFAMIRAGYRGYTEGQVYADEYFKANMRGALNAGLDVGVYFFSQATSVEEAVEEAKFVLKIVKGWDITYPIVFDWEFIENSTARTYSMTAEEVTDCAMAFCETIAYAGYTPMIYFGQNASISHFDLERLMVFDFWLADYTDTPVFPYDFQMWQYTSKGQIDGITGDVDVNYCFTEYKTTEASQ